MYVFVFSVGRGPGDRWAKCFVWAKENGVFMEPELYLQSFRIVSGFGSPLGKPTMGANFASARKMSIEEFEVLEVMTF